MAERVMLGRVGPASLRAQSHHERCHRSGGTASAKPGLSHSTKPSLHDDDDLTRNEPTLKPAADTRFRTLKGHDFESAQCGERPVPWPAREFLAPGQDHAPDRLPL